MTPRALLVHGLQSSPASWWRVTRWLAEAGWEVTTATLLGHGGRERAEDYSFDAYATDLGEHGTGWDLVVAHSLGGAVSSVLARRRPDWTRRLVLVDPAVFVMGRDRELLVDDLLSDLSVTADSLITAFPHWEQDDVDAKLSAVASMDPEVAERTVAANPVWDVREEIGGVRAPTLLLTGDPAVFTMDPPELAEELLAGNPRVRYHAIAGAGHSPHRDRPEATRDALLGWLAETA